MYPKGGNAIPSKYENLGVADGYRCSVCKGKAVRVNADPAIRTTVMILHVVHSNWCTVLAWKRAFLHLDGNDLYLPENKVVI
jgi:hypothetical protein